MVSRILRVYVDPGFHHLELLTWIIYWRPLLIYFFWIHDTLVLHSFSKFSYEPEIVLGGHSTLHNRGSRERCVKHNSHLDFWRVFAI